MSAPEIATTVAETIRRLGSTASIMLQPFGDHYTGELWTVSVNQSRMGQGETLELALVDLATNPLNAAATSQSTDQSIAALKELFVEAGASADEHAQLDALHTELKESHQ